MKHNVNHKKIWLEWVPMGVCAVAILACAFVFKQKWYKVLPTLNTLVILLLSARVDRRSFLLGGLNAALYGIGYFGEGLYFSVINCLLVSMPLQLFSFFHWRRHADGNSTKLRTLGWKGHAVVVFSTALGCLLCHWFLLPFFAGEQQAVLDIFLFVIGLVITVLSMLRYVEAPYYNLISSVANLVMWILICTRNIADLNYLIMAAYSFFRVVQSAVTWTKQYQKSQKESLSQTALSHAE
ncbi:MAG: nicotinamide mononucleotide transporter [Clostridia bacterium]|nr:nicotinamide mononucleotide transporter [Clostridia bacterium]